MSGRIEGIGRPRVEKSFIRAVIDSVIRVPDTASIAGLRFIEGLLGKKVGGSTGTNVFAVFQLISQMIESHTAGSVVTLLCDDGERYTDTYYSDSWLHKQGLDISDHISLIEQFAKLVKL